MKKEYMDLLEKNIDTNTGNSVFKEKIFKEFGIPQNKDVIKAIPNIRNYLYSKYVDFDIDFFNSLMAKAKRNNFYSILKILLEGIEIMKADSLKTIEKYEVFTNSQNLENNYTKARKMKRKILTFLGPTNSGKTYLAIEKLKKAKKGLYLAPLRLLAREAYDKLKEDGIKVSLITGEEKIIDEEATHICSTIEMLDINSKYDVAVIDEIQFIGNYQRGAAWSRALLGVLAKEVICIGSVDSKEVIEKIADLCNDSIEHKAFERLSPLSIIGHENIEKGDAVIAFSRKDVLNLKTKIEKKGLSVAVIYGGLPPEVRVNQSKLFNSGEKDVLVASDAIGYGLNLNIKRILFSTLLKFNGNYIENIDQTTFNQIAGRAGRYGRENNGLVGYLMKSDESLFRLQADKLHQPLPPLKNVYYFPEFAAIEKLSKQMKTNSLNKILYFYQKIFTNEFFKFSAGELKAHLKDRLDEAKISLKDKFTLYNAPIKNSSEQMFLQMIKKIENQEKIDKDIILTDDYMNDEDLAHKASLYIWMTFRFELFTDIKGAKFIYDEAVKRLNKNLG